MVLTSRLYGGTPFMLLPSKNTSPLSGSRKPAISRRVVVLPQPEEPNSVTNSPSRIDRLRSSSTFSPSNSTEIFLSAIIVLFSIFCIPLCGQRPRIAVLQLCANHNRAITATPAKSVLQNGSVALPVCVPDGGTPRTRLQLRFHRTIHRAKVCGMAALSPALVPGSEKRSRRENCLV